MRGLTPGSVLLFYRSKSPGYVESQSVTSVGIVEAVTDAHSLEELVRLTARRSVYSTSQLEGFGSSIWTEDGSTNCSLAGSRLPDRRARHRLAADYHLAFRC
jgi:hypothetical protein